MAIGVIWNAKNVDTGEIAMTAVDQDVVITPVVKATTCIHMTLKVVQKVTDRKIYRHIYQEIISSFDFQQEDGGILGIKDDVISAFCFDKGSRKNGYDINIDKFMNTVEKWDEQGIEFIGFIHSHITDNIEPSLTDLMYARKFLKANEDIESIDFPILGIKNNQLIIQYYIFKNNQFIPVNIEIIDC